jgi:hypothetical protein
MSSLGTVAGIIGVMICAFNIETSTIRGLVCPPCFGGQNVVMLFM